MILRCASLLVPGQQRAEWLAEWRSELWYVRQRGRRGELAFCLGAFRDALWVRRNPANPSVRKAALLQSPVHCILFLAILAAVSLFFAFRLPFSRDLILPSPYRDARELVMISSHGHFKESGPTVSIAEYQSLAKRSQHLFTGLAFYRPVVMRVTAVRHETAELSVALASGNLFELLGTPAPSTAIAPSRARLLLSNAAWRKYFNGDPLVAGVIPAGSRRLPGGVDAWLLEDQRSLAALPPDAKGFVIGRLRTSARHPHISVPNDHGSYDVFDYASLSHSEVVLPYLFMIALALIILPATTSLTLGEYPRNIHTPARRWIFLGIKLALILPIVFCGTLDLASLIALSGIQPHATLVAYILAFRWAITDQRRRCPVCLRLVTNPTSIGQASQTFLELYGTELVCLKGHGLLHVPEITNSYSTQRWLYLDPSWSSLFT